MRHRSGYTGQNGRMSHPSRRLRRAAILVIGVLALATSTLACSSSTKQAESEPTTTVSSTKARASADSTASEISTDTGASESTTDVTATPPPGDTGTLEAGDDLAGSKFCKQVKAVMTDPAMTDQSDSLPTSDALAHLADLFGEVADVAPAEIKGDVQIAEQFMRKGASVNPKDSAAMQGYLSDTQAEKASDRFQRFVTGHCGFDPFDLGDAGPVEPRGPASSTP